MMFREDFTEDDYKRIFATIKEAILGLLYKEPSQQKPLCFEQVRAPIGRQSLKY